MNREDERLGLGWVPDYPDIRDYTEEHEEVAPIFKHVRMKPPRGKRLNPSENLSRYCSPIENQGSLGSCTAHAAVSLVEYYERRAFGRHIDASRLFLYKATRNLLQWTGDTGAYLRTTMGALVLFGVPPEKYWPYWVADFDEEPPAFCYAYAQNYQAIRYVSLDPLGTSSDVLLRKIKTFLGAGFPSMFGFTVYSSIAQAAADGMIPYPGPGETVRGGHAVVAVGYDDRLKIKNVRDLDGETTGALLVRNSWGTGWGDHGYGWLPYKYVETGLARDWWTLVNAEWVDTGVFGFPK